MKRSYDRISAGEKENKCSTPIPGGSPFAFQKNNEKRLVFYIGCSYNVKSAVEMCAIFIP